jgi:asparagine synthase (glutamine-hydrolysing)
MCRIVGYYDLDNKYTGKDILLNMRDTMIYGGPDAEGVFIKNNLGLAHRRLSIIDLTSSGNQPMEIGDWVITYNGEIYNYLEIKNELILLGYVFKTKTDTEVIINSYDMWGASAFQKFRGMFAFALYNISTKKLLLCRDRMGVKPLYYYFKDGLFLFASEIKAFHKHPLFDKTLDLSGLPHFLQKGFFKPNTCIFKYVHQLPGGMYLEINENQKISKSKYWDIEQVYNETIIDKRSEVEISEELEKKLFRSFNLRMISDVEVGVFLSGGIDSSLITALLSKNSHKKLNTFTIGFEDKNYNEAIFAKQISEYLGTNHESLICTNSDVEYALPLMPEMHDEPFADSSSIPTYLVSKLASEHVKVALSGDGGDELFGGYTKYKVNQQCQRLMQIPLSLRKALRNGTDLFTREQVEYISEIFLKKSYTQISDKFLKFQELLIAKDLDDMFDKSSNFLSDSNTKLFTNCNYNKFNQHSKIHENGLISYYGYCDILSYLPGNILTKIDRASMSVSLESREPFLDPELIAFSFGIPDKFKISKNGESKYLLKSILSKYIPIDLIDRPKQGFSVPIRNWLHSILKNELYEIENDEIFFKTFELNQEFFSEVLKSFFTNRNKFNPYFLWIVYCLYKWYKKWI